jgi:hypothetical protein
MGGGLMQLVAMGAQDVYLTGNPQITFFKVVYRRHTNFSKECIAQTFNGNAGYGKSVTCTLSRNGDLVQEIYLRAKLTTTVENPTDVFSLSDVTNLIKSVEVEIGGQKIDKHYSQWLDIYNELFETDSSHARRLSMNSVTNFATATGVTTEESTFYIPLRFWFNRNPGLALPLIALQYHEVKINVTLGNYTDLVGNAASTGNLAPIASGEVTVTTASTGANQIAVAFTSADLLVNYLYLDTDERRRFAQVSHEYLIEQVQHTGVETSGNITMNFNHPVKALFWNSENTDRNDDSGNNKPGATLGATKLQLNGHDRFSEQAHDYFHLVQPYECGLGHSKVLNTGYRGWVDTVKTATTSNVGMYSFCLKPAEHQPSGTCNFSRIDNAKLNITSADASATKPIYLFALNYNVLRIMSGMGGLAYSN